MTTKQNHLEKNDQATVTVRKIRTSSQKLNLVASTIRGLPVEQALSKLIFSKKRMAIVVRKALESAIANAENNHGLDPDQLVVSEASVGPEGKMRRFRARARGRVGKILKPFSRLRLVVQETNQENV